MPYRNYGINYTKMQFTCALRLPSLIYKACVAKGVQSNTRYIQEAVVARLAEDLGIDYDELMAEMPSSRRNLLPNEKKRPLVGSVGTVEDVR